MIKQLRSLLLFAVLLGVSGLFVNSANATVAYPNPIKITQIDGTTITILKYGDEFFNWTTTSDGYDIVQKNGIYYYAHIEMDGSRLVSQQKASEPAKRSVTERSFLAKKSGSNTRIFSTAVSATQRAAYSDKTKSTYPTTGKIKTIILLVEYSDIKFSTSSPQNKFTRLLNEKGYSDNGANGSAYDYYYQNSKGQFDGEFVVAGPFTLENTMAYYGANNNKGNDIRSREMIEDAAKIASKNGVDFSQFDLDNDGIVDNIFVFYAGYSESSGGPETSIWPHKWMAINRVIVNGKEVRNYACASELRNNSGTIMASIGTFAHEYGHVIGLPDLYDTDGAVNGTANIPGDYSIMANGNYVNNGNTPPMFGILERSLLGWDTPIVINKGENKDITIKPISSGEGYRVDTENPGEYFLIENRQISDNIWDLYLDNSGLVIFHIDRSAQYLLRWNNNSVNDFADHPCARLVYGNGTKNFKSAFYTGKIGSNRVWGENSIPKAAGWSNKFVGTNISNITQMNDLSMKFTVNGILDTKLVISGIVTNASGDPIPNATVKISTTVNKSAGELAYVTKSSDDIELKTEANGEFRSNVLAKDTYNISAEKANYLGESKSFTLNNTAQEIRLSMIEIDTKQYTKVALHNGVLKSMIGFSNGSDVAGMVIFSKDILKNYVGNSIRRLQMPTRGTKGRLLVFNKKDTRPIFSKEALVANKHIISELSDGELVIEIGKDYIIGFDITEYNHLNKVFPIPTDTQTGTSHDGVTNNYYTRWNWGIFNDFGNIMLDLFIAENKTAPTSITLPESIELEVASSQKIEYLVAPKNANSSVVWSSSNEKIAKVSENGTVTGIDIGTTEITATSSINSSVKSTMKVNVKISTNIEVKAAQNSAIASWNAIEKNSYRVKYNIKGSSEILTMYTTDPNATLFPLKELSTYQIVVEYSEDNTVWTLLNKNEFLTLAKASGIPTILIDSYQYSIGVVIPLVATTAQSKDQTTWYINGELHNENKFVPQSVGKQTIQMKIVRDDKTLITTKIIDIK